MWDDVVALFKFLGCTVTEGEGSRVRVKFGNERGLFHRPHPGKETDKGAVKSVRTFLSLIITKDEE